MPQVSVLLPCFAAAATLEETLASLARQTHPDFEVVIVDDGSTDDTSCLLDSWTQQDSRFRVISAAHRGIIPTLNLGLEACRGPYIARLDADDLAHPERLALQAAFLDAHPEVTLVSCLAEGFPLANVREGFRLYLEWLNSLISDAEIRREIFVESPFPHPSVMFRAAFVRELGGYEEHGWAEDYDLWLRMYLAGARFAKIPRPLLSWREHPTRLTRTDSRYAVENFLRAKAHYLVRGPLLGRGAVIVWGAGMLGRRLSKHLAREGAPLHAFIDIDPRKIGNTRRGLPILPPEELPVLWADLTAAGRCPVVLAAVGARGARALIRQRLTGFGLHEGRDWWGVA